METAVRWSQSSVAGKEKFLFVEVVGKSFKLCRVKSRKRGRLKYEILAEQKKVPAFRAFDWSPSHEGIVAVGQSSGEATVLRIDDGSQAALSFPIRNQRLCNAIAFNSQALLASGLDKVRTDNCLNIWDLQKQLPSGNASGFATTSGRMHPEPLYKLASSESITSIKFFAKEPQSLVAGVKGQFVRLYDLRQGPGSASLQLATKCVNNLAIDPMDENYFASCHPTKYPIICIWDRRAGSRTPVAQSGFFSPSSAESTSLQASLELKDVTEAPSSIWSLRFSNARRGCLGMLSSTGHFKTYDIGREFAVIDTKQSSTKPDGQRKDCEPIGHEKLYLNGVQDLQHGFHPDNQGRPEGDRVVSFDFTNLGGSWNEPKAITLTDDGHIAEISIPIIPEPEIFSSVGLIHKGRRQTQRPPDLVKVVLGRDSDRKPATKVTWVAAKAPGATEMVGQYIRCMNGYLFSLKKNRTITSDHAQVEQFWSWLEWVSQERVAGKAVQDGLDLSYLGISALWMDDLGPRPHDIRRMEGSSTRLAKATESLVQRLNIPASKTCATDFGAARRICLYHLHQAWTREQLEKLITELISQKQHTKAAAIAMSADEARLAYHALRSSSVRFHKMLAMAIVSATKRADHAGDENDDEWAETIEALASDLTDPFARAILSYVKENEWNAVIEEKSLPLSYRIGIAVRWLKDSSLTEYISRTTEVVVKAGDLNGIVLTGLRSNAAFDLLGNYVRRSGDLQTAVLALTWTIPRYVDDKATKRRFMSWRETYREYMNSWNLHFDRADFDIGSSKIAVDAGGKRLWEPAKPQVALKCGYCNRSIAQFDPEGGEVGAESDAMTTDTMATSSINIHRTQRHPLTSEKAAAIGTICPKCGRRLPRCGVCDMELGMPDPSFLKWSARVLHANPPTYPPTYPHHRQNRAGGSSADLSASIGGGSAITTLGGPSLATAITTRSSKGSSDPSHTAAASVATNTRSSKSASELDKAQTSKAESTASATAAAGTTSSTAAASTSSSRPPASTATTTATRLLEETREQDEQERVNLESKFIVYCIKCNHGFHANHAIEWFRGGGDSVANGSGGKKWDHVNVPQQTTTTTTTPMTMTTMRPHSVCPVSECSCICEM